jgi:large conductance mechanosensitive channel protein
MLKEFRDFALKGNVMDLAIGVIIGGAFGKIVTSLVNDIIMPLLSLITGNINFTNMLIPLRKVEGGKDITLNYGTFITNIIDFIIIAFSIFIVIRQINKLIPKKTAEVTTKSCPYCQSNISIKAVRCPHCTSQLEETN